MEKNGKRKKKKKGEFCMYFMLQYCKYIEIKRRMRKEKIIDKRIDRVL